RRASISGRQRFHAYSIEDPFAHVRSRAPPLHDHRHRNQESRQTIFRDIQKKKPALFAPFDGHQGTGVERDQTDRHAARPRLCLDLGRPSSSAKKSARCCSVMRLPASSESSAAWRFASLAIAATSALTFPPYERDASCLRMRCVSRSTEIEKVAVFP